MAKVMQKGKITRGTPRTRPGEKIGGGFFVFRRGDFANRIRISDLPFEHPNYESAQKEAERLSAANPGMRYDVLGVLDAMKVPVE